MKKLIAAVSIAGLLMSLAAAPALAGKKKTVTEDWTATNPVPFPGMDAGCGGQETLSRSTHPFTAPGTGSLNVTMDNFQVDWDLYVYDSAGNLLAASEGDSAATTEQIVGLKLKKAQEVGIVLCNWSGGPTADGHLVYTYK